MRCGISGNTFISNTFLARLLSKLNPNDDAEQAWQALIEQNPDNYDYYRGFLYNRGVDLGARPSLVLAINVS